MLDDAIGFLRASDDWAATTLIGGLLFVLGVFVLPALVVQGYLLRVSREAAGGADAAPSFTRWGDLLVDGLKADVVEVVYGVAAAVPFVLAVLWVDPEAESLGLPVVAGLLLAVVLTVVVSYVLPAALVNFAVEGRLGAAFDLGTVADVVLTREYLVAVALSLLVGLVGGAVGAALSVLLVGVFVLFYVQVSVFYLYGRGYATALGARGRR